jgi:hypothetical protein
MATIAVFIALGGSAVAAVSLTRGSVKGKHIARNAITAKKVKNRSLRGVDFALGQLPKGDAGPQGPPGEAGTPGAPGAPGSPSAGMVTGQIPVNKTNELASVTVTYIPSGLSDGGQTLSPNKPVVLSDLAVDLTDAPGAGSERHVRLGFGAATSDENKITCTLAGDDQTCDTGDQSVTVPPGSSIGITVRNGAPGPADTTIRFGYRATMP